jgi:hypothetical protein
MQCLQVSLVAKRMAHQKGVIVSTLLGVLDVYILPTRTLLSRPAK